MRRVTINKPNISCEGTDPVKFDKCEVADEVTIGEEAAVVFYETIA
jgi:hypothetical protein